MATEITTDELRRLAETRQAQGRVLSLYINLDPREFATQPARATEINAVLDEADRKVRDHDDLTHDERAALKRDVERVREAFAQGLDTDGARGLALFVSEPAGLFEVLKLPRAIPHCVAVADGPAIEPLARIGAGAPWWLVLVDRRHARLVAGTLDGVVEVWRLDSETSGQHDQGGYSQSRYQRAIDKEAMDHLRAVDGELQRRIRETQISGILVGGPAETVSALQELLHADVRKCVKGRFEAGVWTTTADEVLAAATPALAEQITRRDERLLERLEQGLATGGRAAAGLDAVLTALHERRVETLLVEEGFTAAGLRCPQCGWLGARAGAACPADGTRTEPLANVVETAVETAFGQDARVLVLPSSGPLEAHGSIAALTRF